MARKKKTEEEISEPVANVKLPKPKFNVDDKVVVTFLGMERNAIVIAVRQHPSHPRWIYKVRDSHGTIIPWVGLDGAEKFANIWTKPKQKTDEE